MPNYGYYLPLSEKIFDAVRFLDISAKTEGRGSDEHQKTDKEGTPMWTISALVKFQGGKQETETFTLTAPKKDVDVLSEIAELTPIRLIGLQGGKWSKEESSQTSWSFQISGVAKL